MAKPIVYHVPPEYRRFRYESGLVGRFEKALEKVNLGRYIGKDKVVPLKMHLGNRGAFRTVRPQLVKMVADAVKKIPAKPFVTDSARLDPYDYLATASDAGYNAATLGAPVVIADGIYGKDVVNVKAGRLLKEVSVPSAIHDAESMIVLTHVKGHIQAVLGGSIKNIAMGGIARASRWGDWHTGRGKIHFLMNERITWNSKKCVHCQDCVKICPVQAISFPDGKTYTVDSKLCWSCGRCARICPLEALSIPISHQRMQEALAEGAAAVLSTFKKKRVVYINFLLEIQPDCDCMPVADPPVAPDLGILISDDLVAVETATLDMLARTKPVPGSRAEKLEMKPGWDILSLVHKKDARVQVAHAEKLGLGSSKYNLVKI